ncbi:MAG: glycosyltransferase [Saprospiraceae bacterium]|nr:glycosyltransferase [Saprospiraceae bacterium]
MKKQIFYNPNNIYLLVVGRMVKDKGITELVDAFEEVAPQYNGKLKLILVGPKEDELDPLPNSTLNKIASNENIIEVGFSNKVAYFMSIADILIHPSHREGFPNVLLQAGVMKCPIICSNISGNIDIIENETEGTVFDVKNVSSLVHAIHSSLDNYIITKEKAENLYQKIVANFDRSIVQSEYLKLYNTLLEKARF